MTASEIENAKVTNLTLYFLESTGWYQPDYSMGEPIFWGKGMGCGFINNDCIGPAPNYQSEFPEFCSKLMQVGCTNMRLQAGYCGATDIYTDPSLNANVNYWENNTIVYDYFADNCPYIMPYSNRYCEVASSTAMDVTEYFGTGSRCFMGTLSSAYDAYCLKNWVRNTGNN